MLKADNGNIYLEHCPQCRRENYAPMVSRGVCCWCGYDANKIEYNKEHDKELLD